MDDRAHDPEQETALDLKKCRTGRFFECITKKCPQVFSFIVVATGCLDVKAAGFLEREGKHISLSSFSWFFILSPSSFLFFCQVHR